LDKHAYPTGMKVSTEDMKRLNLSPAKFHLTFRVNENRYLRIE